MSGGVDSSVAAKLLKDQGHEVVGIFLHFWKEENKGQANFENKCCSTQALLDAQLVAEKIGIPLYVLNFSQIFKKQVVDDFLTEYSRGKTPNPCVRCNKLVKLGFLIKLVKELSFDFVASGHYIKKSANTGKLYKAKDKAKDQSYFLYTFNQNELKHLLFPLGDYTKPQVRQLAKKFKLPVALKKDSQEVCFIPDKSHNEFLKRHLKLNPGKIKTPDKKIVGLHLGLPLYTVGQRRGIAIGGTGPYYAAKMDYKNNTLYVVNNSQDPILYSSRLTVKNVNWLYGRRPKLPFKCQAVIRYGHKPVKCLITKNNKNYLVKLARPQRAIAPGQSAVFYNQDELLGGGIICQN